LHTTMQGIGKVRLHYAWKRLAAKLAIQPIHDSDR